MAMRVVARSGCAGQTKRATPKFQNTTLATIETRSVIRKIRLVAPFQDTPSQPSKFPYFFIALPSITVCQFDPLAEVSNVSVYEVADVPLIVSRPWVPRPPRFSSRSHVQVS